MKKEKERKHFIEKPVYPGGEKALTEFLYKHLRYPPLAAEANVEGTVFLEYDIDHRGNVVDVRVLQSLGSGCDEEAVRVIKLLKFDMGKYRGVKVIFHRKAKIIFKKPKPQPAPAPTVQQVQMQLNYTVVPSAPASADQPAAEAPPKTFSYTIQF